MSGASVIDYAVTAAVLGAIAWLLFRFIRQVMGEQVMGEPKAKDQAKKCHGCGQADACANSLPSPPKPEGEPPS